MTLPSIFWANNYWINDYYDYGLGAPPPGTVWVRYGSDAILIDRYTGEILEVVYDQFY
jgi:Ni/Co efflux regulator RcnB